MTERVRYSNAPITEATIDLRIVQPTELSIDELAALQEMLRSSYPRVEEEYIYSEQTHAEIAGDPSQIETSHWRSGFRFTSQDEHYVLYARLDGFALSVRAPYDRWESFSKEARRLWDLYRSIARPEGVTRVALRYVNRLDLPQDPDNSNTISMESYLRVYPEVPSDWPGSSTMGNYFMQLQFWQEDLEAWLVVNEAPVWSNMQEPARFQLDFDFFREQFEEPWQADDDSEVWDFVEQLHVRKNQVFEASITDATRRLIR